MRCSAEGRELVAAVEGAVEAVDVALNTEECEDVAVDKGVAPETLEV